MSDQDRNSARAALNIITPMLKRIGTGWLFCGDRGYEWTVETEEREGRSTIAKALADNPILAPYFPKTIAQLAEGELLGDVDGYEEARNALAALA
jgi:hypothetical protein